MKKGEDFDASKVYDTLLALANSNKSFTEERIGGFTLSVVNEEPHDLLESLEEDDGEWPLSRFSEEYRFSARRTPIIDGDSIKKVIDLTVTYEAVLENIKLPANIAVDSYGITDPEAAIENGGPSTMKQSVDINIDSEDMELIVHHEVSYEDEDEDEITRICSCKNTLMHEEGSQSVYSLMPKRTYWAKDEHDDDCDALDSEDEDEDEDGYAPIRMSTQFSLNAARELESVSDLSEKEMYQMMDLQDEMEIAKVEQDFATAHAVIASMKRAFREQLGLNI